MSPLEATLNTFIGMNVTRIAAAYAISTVLRRYHFSPS